MADSASVFNADVVGRDLASGPIGKIAASMRGLSGLTDSIGKHAAGMGAVVRAAFGEAERGAHGAGSGARGAGTAIKGAGDAAKKAGKEIEHAANPRPWIALAGHVRILRGHFGNLSGSIGAVGGSISSLMPALAGLGAGASLAGVFSLTEHVSQSFAELNKSAIQAGMSASQFGSLSYAARMTDVNVQSMGTGLNRLNRAIGDVASGKNKDASALFRHLGIATRDANGHMVSAGDILPRLAEAFKNTTDPAMRARMAMALFGRGGVEMLPLLTQGAAGLEQFADASKGLRYAFSPQDRENLEAYHHSTINLSTAVTGFSNAIGAKLAPVLQPIIEAMTQWIATNRDWIAQGLAAKVEELAGWFKSLDIKAISEEFRSWGSTILSLGGTVSQLHGGLLLIGSVLAGPLIASVGMTISIFGNLTSILKGLAALAWANPILAAVGALGLAAYEIYEHWGAIKEFFINLWGGITAAFSQAWEKIKPILDNLKAAVEFMTNNKVTRAASGVVTSIGNAVGSNAEFGGVAPTVGANANDNVPAPIASPYRAGGAAAAAPAARVEGQVKTVVEFKNAPPGMTTRSEASGDVAQPQTDVGYSMAGVVGVN